MDFSSILSQMAVLFAIVIVGAISGRTGLMDADFNRKLSAFVVNITAPSLIMSSVMDGDRLPDSSKVLPLVVLGFSTYAFLIVVGWIISRLMRVPASQKGIYNFMLTFGNVGFIGLAVVASIFGREAVFYASMLIIPSNLLLFVLGVYMVTSGRAGSGWNWRIFFSPFMIATYLSIVIVFAGVKMPYPVAQMFHLLGGITVPASLLIIGASLATMSLRNALGSPMIYLMSVFRLLLIPLAVIYLSRLAGVDSYMAGINAVLAGTPVASFGTMFCLKYGVDDKVMTQGIFISTFLAMFSIPLLAMWL